MNQPNDVAFALERRHLRERRLRQRPHRRVRQGSEVRSFLGKFGQGPGEFSQPHSIVIDSKDRVYVADRNNVRIQIFDSKGKYLTEWRNIITPWALAITKNDEIYVCGSSPMLWSEIPANQAALATPPKDQLFMKLDTEGRLKQLWMVLANRLDPLDRGCRGRSVYLGEVRETALGDLCQPDQRPARTRGRSPRASLFRTWSESASRPPADRPPAARG